jgi:hypothetical protein
VIVVHHFALGIIRPTLTVSVWSSQDSIDA